MNGERIRAFCIVHFALALVLDGCAPSKPPLLPVTLPDLSRVDQGVQTQVRERYDTLNRAMSGSSGAELGSAYGQYGMVLQAAEYFDAAEPCYLNAQRLAPDEMRWPYYLANLYKSRGDTDKAEASFKRALALRPDDLATLIWLGRLHLDQGRPAEAEPLFIRAQAIAPTTVAVLAGRGRVALAKRDYDTAVKYLEEALALDAEADSLHAPLAAAYRGLGQIEKAQPHLRQWRNRDLFVPDPLQQEMDLLLESGLSYELRGIRALEVRDWNAAAGFFRKGLTLARENTPLSRSLHHKLGTALVFTGDLAGAQEQFEAVVRQAPPSGIDEATAKAHYSLGLIAHDRGKDLEAVDHLSAAVTYQPSYTEAHLAYADILRRVGKPKIALAEYDEAAKINPRSVPARLGYAISLVALGQSLQARDWLVELTKQFPDRLEYRLAVARLLAASPDPQVRNPRRTLDILDQYFKQQKTTDVGETWAMALAALDDFKRAIETQRDIMTAAKRSGLNAAHERMAENLRLYEAGQPCRRPWKRDESVFLSERPSTALSN
jgi:tetratricopeptide (TPR) repeat protein